MTDTKELHKALIFTSSSHRRTCRERFRRLDLTDGQPKVLAVLLEREGYLQKDLAKKCHVEPATMSSVIANMERKELIRRETAHVSGGKRAFAVYLTEKGRKTAEATNNVVIDVEKLAFEGFSSEEQEQFLSMLERLGKNLVQKQN